MQGEFDILTSEHTEELFLKSRQTHYEHGERAGSFLCYQLKRPQQRQLETVRATLLRINRVLLISLDLSMRPYTLLKWMTERIERSFSSFELPSLDHSEISALEGNKTVLEIDSAIKKLKSGKVSGPDGFLPS